MRKKFIIFFAIILVNLLLITVVFLFFNYYTYKQYMKSIEPKYYDPGITYTIRRHPFDFDDWLEHSPQRPPFGIQYKKPSVIIFGCSYAYGELLQDKQTFGYKLSEQTKRPVYTLGISGSGIQHALLQVQSNRYNDIIKNSDYAIYLIISEHLWRSVAHSGGSFTNEDIWPVYDVKNGKLVYHKSLFPVLEGSYLYRKIQKDLIVDAVEAKNEFVFNVLFNLLKLHFKTLQAELKKRNPNIKLIIFEYRDYDDDVQMLTGSPRWKELEKEGFIVVHATDLAGEEQEYLTQDKYQIPDDGHPNEAAWNLLTPEFIKQTGIK